MHTKLLGLGLLIVLSGCTATDGKRLVPIIGFGLVEIDDNPEDITVGGGLLVDATHLKMTGLLLSISPPTRGVLLGQYQHTHTEVAPDADLLVSAKHSREGQCHLHIASAKPHLHTTEP